MSWRRLLTVGYVLLTEGHDAEGVREIDRVLAGAAYRPARNEDAMGGHAWFDAEDVA